MVYVLDKNGKPLMPTNRHGKVRHLLEEGKAKVIRREPFTIKLLYETTSYTQDLTLAVDTGTGTLGTAVADTKGNIVYISEVTTRKNDVTKKMKKRANYRRTRRSRKTRRRPARYLNRKNSTKTDRYSPTIVSKTHSHIKEIEFIKSILPITSIVLEVGKFDPHLMKNPELADPDERSWGYQQGPNYGYENVKAMVRARDNYTCQHCKGKSKDKHLEVHHKIYRSQGGSDSEENLITLCHTCHEALHNGEFVLKDSGRKKQLNLRDATQMNVLRCRLLREYPDAIVTYGFVTSANRLALGLDKEHYIDACVIATQGKPFNIVTGVLYLKRDVPEGDYQRTRGAHSEQRLPDGKMGGFMKFDKVEYRGEKYFIKGRQQDKYKNEYASLMDIYGNKADFSMLPKGQKTPKLVNCKRIAARTSQMCDTITLPRNSSHPLKGVGFLANNL